MPDSMPPGSMEWVILGFALITIVATPVTILYMVLRQRRKERRDRPF